MQAWCLWKERGKDGLARKSLWPQPSSKTVSAKLRETSSENNCLLGKYYGGQECPSSRCPPCSLTGWEQPGSSVVLIWAPRWIPRCSSWGLASHLCPHRPSRIFRRQFELPHPVGQKSNWENGGRGAGQEKDKNSGFQEGKNPAFSLLSQPSILWIFTFLHSSGCVIIKFRFWRWLHKKRYKTDFMQ